MRIIGGEQRGRQIVPPSNFKARPTTDFAKEALFDILSNKYDFSKISFLDLFSGTGSISYEFASRGCRDITAVEMNPVHAAFIKSSASKLFGSESYAIHVVHHNVFDFIKICKKQFDIIFADPPYDLAELAEIPEKILNTHIFKDHALLIFEHSSRYTYKNNPHFIEERKYGNVHFTFFSAETQKFNKQNL